MALPFRVLQLVRLSPDQVEQTYCIVFRLADLVKMYGLRPGELSCRAWCELRPSSSVNVVRPTSPTSLRFPSCPGRLGMSHAAVYVSSCREYSSLSLMRVRSAQTHSLHTLLTSTTHLRPSV